MAAPQRVKPIIVGYDASSSGTKALRWALAEGRYRQLPVHVTHVVQWSETFMLQQNEALTEEQRSMTRKLVQEAVAAAGGQATQVSIVDGSIVGCLCELSSGAAMIVLGARGHGGFAGVPGGDRTLIDECHPSSRQARRLSALPRPRPLRDALARHPPTRETSGSERKGRGGLTARPTIVKMGPLPVNA